MSSACLCRVKSVLQYLQSPKTYLGFIISSFSYVVCQGFVVFVQCLYVQSLSCLVFVCLRFAMSGTFIDLKYHYCLLCLGFVISYVQGLLCLVFLCLGFVMSSVCLSRICNIYCLSVQGLSQYLKNIKHWQHFKCVCCVLCLVFVVSSVCLSRICCVQCLPVLGLPCLVHSQT